MQNNTQRSGQLSTNSAELGRNSDENSSLVDTSRYLKAQAMKPKAQFQIPYYNEQLLSDLESARNSS